MREPFDRALKQLTAAAARRLLEIAGDLPPHLTGELLPLEREVAGPAIRVDQLFEFPGGGRWIVHFEFQAAWERDMPWRIVRYQNVIRLERPQAEVYSVVFVLRPEGCPPAGDRLHRDGEYSPVNEARYRLIRVWELDPAPILADQGTALLPVAVLMNVNNDQVAEIARRVRAANDPELEAQFAALAGVRYDKDWIAAILGDPMFTKEILKHSWAVQEVMADARVEGRLEGHNEGRSAEARVFLRHTLARDYPGLESMPELEMITDPAALEAIFENLLLRSADRAAVAEAIRRAAQSGLIT